MFSAIDISYAQGHNIDFHKVKEEVDFVLIRCGYGQDDPTQDDSCYRENLNNCIVAGIPYGIYFYSYCDNLNNVQGEIKHFERLLKDVENVPCGLWVDIEESRTKNIANEVAKAFCEHFESKGYFIGIYSNLSYFNSYMDSVELDAYAKWVAEWQTDKCHYRTEPHIWQYSSDGHIDGIVGRVDLNRVYQDLPNIMKVNGLCGYGNPTTKDLKVGDRVKIIATGNSSSYGGSTAAYGIGYEREILKIFEDREFPYQVGTVSNGTSATTGFYKKEALQKL